jgi:hypothetical protein
MASNFEGKSVLITGLRDPAVRRAITDLGGHDLTDAGTVHALDG